MSFTNKEYIQGKKQHKRKRRLLGVFLTASGIGIAAGISGCSNNTPNDDPSDSIWEIDVSSFGMELDDRDFREAAQGHDKVKIINAEELVKLNCQNSNLTQIDISNCVNLKRFQCNDNKLTELNLSANVKLEDIYCRENKLRKLDLSTNINLETLDCAFNDITNTLDLTTNVNLTTLYCNGNLNLTSIDGIDEESVLEELFCGDTRLNWQIMNFTNLKKLTFSNLEFTSAKAKPTLDFSDFTRLETLRCENSKYIKIIKYAGNTLQWLYCANNQSLETLDIENAANLLNVVNNIDLANCTNLSEINLPTQFISWNCNDHYGEEYSWYQNSNPTDTWGQIFRTDGVNVTLPEDHEQNWELQPY